MAAGIRAVWPDAQIDRCPMSDGGEGFVDAMVSACGGRFVTHRVTGPLPEMAVDARFGLLDSQPCAPSHAGGAYGPSPACAVIEMSAASGLALLSRDQYDPYATTTFGTGELLRAAVERGCRAILLGIGGSATIDGGIGCCQAAGLPVLLDDGEPTSPTEPLCGRDLPRVVRVKSHRGESISGVQITVACDVTNPLCGPRGAAHVFGAQKFSGRPAPGQLEEFDQWLRQYAARCGKLDIAELPGAGAAGGLGFALMAFFGASMQPGAELVIEATGLRQRLRGADLCITGEGRFDRSSLDGKAPVRVAELCRMVGVPCHAVVGTADPADGGPFDSIGVILDRAGSFEQSQARAAEFGAQLAAEILSKHLGAT